MKRQIIITGDGSTTIHIPEWNEQYHSKHGAIQEAYHVFIKYGLQYYLESNTTLINSGYKTSVLEIGFGTGLNALITLIEAEKLRVSLDYVGVEAYPISIEERNLLNYPAELKRKDLMPIFEKLHEAHWGELCRISDSFNLTKRQQLFSEVKDLQVFDIIYFDAFGARVQPELWTETIFKIMFRALKVGGVLVTYSAKGSVRRAMQAVGFKVERLPGPPGKREMLRAIKVQ